MTGKLAQAISERFGEDFAVAAALDDNAALRQILEHRSCRDYKPDAIDPGTLRLLFAAALSAPSKSDLQQADIVHVAAAAKRREIETLIPSMPWIAGAPVFLVICGNNRRIRQLCELRGKPFANDHLDSFMNAAVDAGIVLMNLIRAAEALGLGCCPISVIRNHAARVSELLQLPAWVFPLAGLCLGHPAAAGRISARLPLAVTVHTDSYDETALEQQVDVYDRRRAAPQPFARQRYPEDYGEAAFYGWSEDKTRQVSKPERADFGAFIRGRGFKLD